MKQPILTQRQLRISRRTLLFAKYSIGFNFVVALGKIAMGLLTGSIFVCVGGCYNIGIVGSKLLAVRGKVNIHTDTNYLRRVAWFVVFGSLSYMSYCIYLALWGSISTRSYNLIVALTISAFVFGQICVYIYGFFVARYTNDTFVKAVKMTNFANILIGLSLVQTVLLGTFDSNINLSLYSGLLGIVTSAFALSVGIIMLVKN
ncbi:MAG: hypothetical protein LBK70_00915 [Clostridiales bacterium]|jgi:membrane protein CcdC involved in cytochrome C biogenesis|nr:hypothetical protein [Clostridiales bacterium]